MAAAGPGPSKSAAASGDAAGLEGAEPLESGQDPRLGAITERIVSADSTEVWLGLWQLRRSLLVQDVSLSLHPPHPARSAALTLSPLSELQVPVTGADAAELAIRCAEFCSKHASPEMGPLVYLSSQCVACLLPQHLGWITTVAGEDLARWSVTFLQFLQDTSTKSCIAELHWRALALHVGIATSFLRVPGAASASTGLLLWAAGAGKGAGFAVKEACHALVALQRCAEQGCADTGPGIRAWEALGGSKAKNLAGAATRWSFDRAFANATLLVALPTSAALLACVWYVQEELDAVVLAMGGVMSTAVLTAAWALGAYHAFGREAADGAAAFLRGCLRGQVVSAKPAGLAAFPLALQEDAAAVEAAGDTTAPPLPPHTQLTVTQVSFSAAPVLRMDPDTKAYTVTAAAGSGEEGGAASPQAPDFPQPTLPLGDEQPALAGPSTLQLVPTDASVEQLGALAVAAARGGGTGGSAPDALPLPGDLVATLGALRDKLAAEGHSAALAEVEDHLAFARGHLPALAGGAGEGTPEAGGAAESKQ